MKLQEYSFSNKLRQETDFMDFFTNVYNLLNLGRYQMRIVTVIPTYAGEGGEHLLYISGTVKRLYWYDDINSTWQFIEWNGSGQGQTAVVAVVQLTGQAVSIAKTTLYTPAVAGLYRVSVYHLCTKAGSGGTLDTTITWTDSVQAQSIIPAAQVALTGKGNGGTGSVFISSGASAIEYSTTVAGEGGAPEYSLEIVVEKLA